MIELNVDILKAQKASPVGTEKTWGGKVYIKTSNGWRPKGKEKATQKDEDVNTKEIQNPSVEQFAKDASEKQLQSAINDPKQSDEVKAAAKKELQERSENSHSLDVVEEGLKNIINAASEFDEDFIKTVKNKLKELQDKKKKTTTSEKPKNKPEQTKESLSKEFDEKLKEKQGFKKITQTYVKIGDKTIVLNMKGEDKYRARKGSFYLESEVNEPLVDFKKRVREVWEKSETEAIKEIKKENKLPKTQEFENIQIELKSTPEDEEVKALKEEINKYDNINNPSLRRTFFSSKHKRQTVNRVLVERGEKPILFPEDFKQVKGSEYNCYDQLSPLEASKVFKENYKYKGSLSSEEKEGMEAYSNEMYTLIRGYNDGLFQTEEELNEYAAENDVWNENGEPWRIDYIRSIVQGMEQLINRVSLNENVVLSRRITFHRTQDLQEWLSKEKGDILEDKSFASFSLRQLSEFGDDFQITLLAKKGDKILGNPKGYDEEQEMIVQKGTKYRILEKGFNSILVEIVN